jgi:hypothetical protein
VSQKRCQATGSPDGLLLESAPEPGGTRPSPSANLHWQPARTPQLRTGCPLWLRRQATADGGARPGSTQDPETRPPPSAPPATRRESRQAAWKGWFAPNAIATSPSSSPTPRPRPSSATLQPPYRLVGLLLYGCGLRLMECVNLRVQCFNLNSMLLTVHDDAGKGRMQKASIECRASNNNSEP